MLYPPLFNSFRTVRDICSRLISWPSQPHVRCFLSASASGTGCTTGTSPLRTLTTSSSTSTPPGSRRYSLPSEARSRFPSPYSKKTNGKLREHPLVHHRLGDPRAGLKCHDPLGAVLAVGDVVASTGGGLVHT